ncbi:MAG: DUF3962 domain-containing protein [Actinobacteria bacterium]|nr:DUF3962 domain-containing protein [Actinomycetota bacterium]
MAPRYDHLAVTVLQLACDMPIERDYHLMCLPGRWKEPLRRLAEARRNGGPVSIPITSLNDAITALVPDCVVTLKYAGRGDDDQDWLLAYHPVAPAAIHALVAAWVRAQPATPQQISQTLAQLSVTDLNWTPVRINLADRADQTRAMRLLPMEIAARLTRPDATCPHGNLRFLRCPSDNGAEIISWPPERIDDELPFSIKIGITAQTLPTSDETLIYLSFGVRRWMHKRGQLAFDHGHSVYLAPTVPYLRGLENSRHLGIAKIRRLKTTDADGVTAWAPRWADNLAKVLREAGCLARLPDPRQLVDQPLDFLQGQGDAAALVYSTGMLESEKVSAGLSVADRNPLMNWVASELAPQLSPATPLPRVKGAIYKSLGGIDQAAITPEYLSEVVGPRLVVELHTDTDQATQYALDRLALRLGCAAPRAEDVGEAGMLIELGPATVEIRRPQAAAIRADLDRRGGSVASAVERRVHDIESTLPPADAPTIALVDIAAPDAYQGARTGDDPKFAIRHGLLRTGRLSQFVTPLAEPKRAPRVREGRYPADPNRERLAAAVDDLLRQLGIRPTPLPEPARDTLARRPALLAIWVIRKNRNHTWGVGHQVPVAVLIDPSGRQVQVRAPKVNWQPLHTGLLEIGKQYVNIDLRCGPDDVIRFIHDVLDEAGTAFSDTLLVTHAQNLRSLWNGLSNTRLHLDVLDLGAPEPRPISTLPGLRHVRIRTATGGETPECYGVAEDETGQPQGLWQFRHPRVFGSTSGKPSTHTSAVKGISKIVPGERDGQQAFPRPKALVWNPQFIEVLVAGVQDGDVIHHWAALTHELRDAAPYVRDTTVLPWPLHIAEQIEEYLLPAKISTVPGNDTGE